MSSIWKKKIGSKKIGKSSRMFSILSRFWFLVILRWELRLGSAALNEHPTKINEARGTKTRLADNPRWWSQLSNKLLSWKSKISQGLFNRGNSLIRSPTLFLTDEKNKLNQNESLGTAQICPIYLAFWGRPKNQQTAFKPCW